MDEQITKSILFIAGSYGLVQVYNSMGLGQLVNGLLDAQVFPNVGQTVIANPTYNSYSSVELKAVNFYNDTNKDSKYVSFDIGSYSPPSFQNDTISAVLINDPSVEVVMYDDGLNGGRSLVLWPQDGFIELPKLNFNDKASFIQVRPKRRFRLKLVMNDGSFMSLSFDTLLQLDNSTLGSFNKVWRNDSLKYITINGDFDMELFSDGLGDGKSLLVPANTELDVSKYSWFNNQITSMSMVPKDYYKYYVILFAHDKLYTEYAIYKGSNTGAWFNIPQHTGNIDWVSMVLVCKGGCTLYWDSNLKNYSRQFGPGLYDFRNTIYDKQFSSISFF